MFEFVVIPFAVENQALDEQHKKIVFTCDAKVSIHKFKMHFKAVDYINDPTKSSEHSYMIM